ncbi:methylated-DNA--[protein]-cysteine S-methyltransferase [Ramlibacter sp.]|uniref:methylated-DNA--[protein]-cysteine S-methyltransferase n=1 Tax=Ramlibacter sp. TaxID=1917967 RepID=UPI002621BA1F|nr:methylated-DNA--[protein]-cysteine S-methyltransferase [Ramlibacter sp.]MDB5955407.1 methylated-DNA--[protein]-cysteine S-methyltransferase [Ramlibacter sp.]
MTERVCTLYESPLGTMLLAATDFGLAGVWFVGQRHGPDASGWRQDPGHPVLREAIAQLTAYYAGERTSFELPLDLRFGTPFQQSVWTALQAIPRGGTTSYAQIARQLGRPQAARAIGAAVGRNPVSIVVPCHRVLGTGGALTGYAGGLERKTALLRLEGVLAG